MIASRKLRRCLAFVLGTALVPVLLGHASTGAAAGKYGPGVTDTEILIGQTMPYSGPATVLSAVGKVQQRYFDALNQRGGIGGRKIRLISLDDGYNPGRSVAQTRKLVEQENVLLIFASMGTAQNAAAQQYLNTRKVPQLFVYAAADRFADPKQYPWSMTGMSLFSSEARVYAEYVAGEKPAAKVAVLYQNDDLGKEYLEGFKSRLAELKVPARVVATASYEVTDPSVDSQLISLANSGADVFFTAATPRFTSQAIRKVFDLGWRPMHIVPLASNFVATVLKPAGLDKSVGLISATYAKTVGDPEWKEDPGYKEWLSFMKTHYPEGSVEEQLNLSGYSIAVLLTRVLTECGDNLTRENVMRVATRLNKVTLPGVIPQITITTSPTDYELFEQFRLQRFDGTRWVPFGDVVTSR